MALPKVWSTGDASPSTRRPGTANVGLREWLDRSPAHTGIAAAAFDTKVDKPFLPGSAAHKANRRLRRLGCRVIAAPENFRVTGTKGPLLAGEKRRAERWGETLAKAVLTARHTVWRGVDDGCAVASRS